MTVYLDHAATTPMLPEAITAYAEAMANVGNPASIHSQGQRARRMLEEARESVATSLGCEPIEVVFTSGGTEAVNLAIKGMYWARNAGGRRRPRILVPGGEHHATVDAVEWLEAEGPGAGPAEPDWLPLDAEGRIRLDVLEERLAQQPERIALATALWANNEVGTIQPVEQVAALAARYGVPLHLDAVAAYGHVPIDVAGIRARAASVAGALGATGGLAVVGGLAAVSVSAHKIGGPVGIGALVLSRSASVVPLLHGGGQQRQVRSGTQDVAAAVAFAVAARQAVLNREADEARLAGLRDRLIAGVRSVVPRVRLSGPQPASGERLSMNAHFTFPGAQGDSLLFLLDVAGVCVSTGSACQAGIPEPSHVLIAMGRDDANARSALRVTLGHTSTQADVDAFLAALPEAYERASRAGLAERATQLGAR